MRGRTQGTTVGDIFLGILQVKKFSKTFSSRNANVLANTDDYIESHSGSPCTDLNPKYLGYSI